MATRNRAFHLSGIGVRASYEALAIVKEPLFKSDRINARLVLSDGPLLLDLHDLRALAGLLTDAANEIAGMYDERRASDVPD